MKIKWTMYKKIQLTIVGVLILIFAVSQITISNMVKTTLEKTFVTNGGNTSVLLQKNMEVLFNDAYNSLTLMDSQFSGEARDDQDLREYLSLIRKTKPYVSNTFIAFEDGTYILEPHKDLSESFDPTTRDWFQSAFTSRELVWSQPYTDIVTGDIVITGSYFLEFEGTYGVAGLDINLDNLPGFLSIKEVTDNSFIILVDRDDTIIYDSKNAYTGAKLKNIGDKEFLQAGLVTGAIETSQGQYYLRTLNYANMRLIAFIPSQDINRATFGIQVFASIVLISALILGIIISRWMVLRITKPIEGLTETMLRVGKDSELHHYEGSANDEIKTLISGYNTMVDNVNDQKKALKNLSSELMASERKLQEQYDKVSDMAYFDFLTGLPNRLSFEEALRERILADEPFALMYIDLDNFKYINDTYGHNYGDQALKEIGNRLSIKDSDRYFPARLSGDEFGIIFSYDSIEGIEETCLKVLHSIEEPMIIHKLAFKTTGSIGISIYPDDGRSYETLFSNADIAMYEAKKNSKNQYKIFRQSFRKDLIDRVNIETALRNALEKQEIYVCYQTLIDYKTKSVRGFEALARFESKELGFISPDVFIPIAEHNLEINPLGHYVLEKAVSFGLKLFKRMGRYYEINVNVSSVQLHQEAFFHEVIDVLERFDYPAEYLNLEITESVALDTDQVIHDKLKALKAYGIGISIDDFGTGYSSLNHLIDLDLSHLKIDREIILRASHHKIVYRLIQGIVEFAHAMGLKVVAEGIEDERMEELMGQLNVDLCQGYLYSKPLKEEDVYTYLE